MLETLPTKSAAIKSRFTGKTLNFTRNHRQTFRISCIQIRMNNVISQPHFELKV